MQRLARAIAVDYPHHITQKGDYQYPFFDDDNDFKRYLYWLKNGEIKENSAIRKFLQSSIKW